MSAVTAVAKKDEKKPAELKTEPQKIGYAIGVNAGGSFKAQGLDIDLDAFLRGFTEAFTGRELAMTDIEMQQILQAFSLRMQQEQQKKMEEQAGAGKKFLEENKKKKGVKVLPSGLQYKVITEGTGATPKRTDIFVANYRGTLIDGTEFDSSYKRNKPLELPVTQVIPGWTEALQLMKVGSKWEVYIPSDLAYGPQGRPNIPPNSVLIFEMELLDVKANAQQSIPQIKAPKFGPPKKDEHAGHDHQKGEHPK